MSYQTFSLLVVVVCFVALFTWVLWPSNRQRFERYGASILEEQHADKTPANSEELDNKQEAQRG